MDARRTTAPVRAVRQAESGDVFRRRLGEENACRATRSGGRLSSLVQRR
jgi:hypothetical protein